MPDTCSVTDLSILSDQASCIIQNDLILITDQLTKDYVPELDGEIAFTIDSVLMPKSSAPTGVFRFETQVISQYDCQAYTVDRTSGNDLLTATYGDLISVSVTPDSTQAYTLTKSTFSLVPSHDVLKNGMIIIHLPDELRVPNPTVTRNKFVAEGGLDIDAYASVSDVITIHGGFTAGDRPAGSVITFSLDEIMNPISVAPTSSFQVFTAQADGLYYIDG